MSCGPDVGHKVIVFVGTHEYKIYELHVGKSLKTEVNILYV